MPIFLDQAQAEALVRKLQGVTEAMNQSISALRQADGNLGSAIGSPSSGMIAAEQQVESNISSSNQVIQEMSAAVQGRGAMAMEQSLTTWQTQEKNLLNALSELHRRATSLQEQLGTVQSQLATTQQDLGSLNTAFNQFVQNLVQSDASAANALGPQG